MNLDIDHTRFIGDYYLKEVKMLNKLFLVTLLLCGGVAFCQPIGTNSVIKPVRNKPVAVKHIVVKPSRIDSLNKIGMERRLKFDKQRNINVLLNRFQKKLNEFQKGNVAIKDSVLVDGVWYKKDKNKKDKVKNKDETIKELCDMCDSIKIELKK